VSNQVVLIKDELTGIGRAMAVAFRDWMLSMSTPTKSAVADKAEGALAVL
jgi:hypothetical protein